MSKEEYIKRTWEHIAKNWSDEQIKKEVDEWNKLQELLKEHKECKKEISCSNCKTLYCIHLDLICSTINVCVLCDEIAQPFIANPINKKHVLHYMPYCKNIRIN
jgi:hypothetical protein